MGRTTTVEPGEIRPCSREVPLLAVVARERSDPNGAAGVRTGRSQSALVWIGGFQSRPAQLVTRPQGARVDIERDDCQHRTRMALHAELDGRVAMGYS